MVSLPALGQQERQPCQPREGEMPSALQPCLWSAEKDVQLPGLADVCHSDHLVPLAQTPCSSCKLLTIISIPIETDFATEQKPTNQLTAANTPEFTQLSVS